MVNIQAYLQALITALRRAYGERLVYVGLQGSYLRGEAGEDSDVDVMTVIEALSPSDLRRYRALLETLGIHNKACGILCGRDELRHWNRLELCHLLHTTRDCFGVLSELLPPFTAADTREFIRLSLNNLYHEICHRYVFENDPDGLRRSYRQVFFILQNLCFLETGVFCATGEELLEQARGADRALLLTAADYKRGAAVDGEAAFAELFGWLQETIHRVG